MISSERGFRVLLVGRHELACKVLKSLLSNPGIELAVVSSRRDDSGKRPKLAQVAIQNSVRHLGSGNDALFDAIEHFRPNLLVSAGYDRILTADVISRVSRCVNVHFGMLPRYRGSYSIPWAILNNDPEIGVTLHDLALSIDDGPIINQKSFVNDPSSSCRDLYDRAVDIGTEMVMWLVGRTLNDLPPAGIPQDELRATYYPPGYPGDFKIPWRQTVTYVMNYIRAAHFPPYEGAFGEIDGHRIIFDWPVEHYVGSSISPPGTIVEANACLGITVLNGLILPTAVSLNGQRADFADLVTEHALLNRSFF